MKRLLFLVQSWFSLAHAWFVSPNRAPGARPTLKQLCFLTLGWSSLVLALIGAALPLLPTVPFLLLASWSFAQSSPQLERWLHEHPHFGPPIRDWDHHGVIRPGAKFMATLMVMVSLSWLLLGTSAPLPGKILVVVCCTASLCFVVTRPSSVPSSVERAASGPTSCEPATPTFRVQPGVRTVPATTRLRAAA